MMRYDVPMKPIKFHLAWLTVLILLLAIFVPRGLCGGRLTEEEKRYLKNKGEIVFVSQTTYPPFEFVEKNGEHTGMCIELARWMATEFGFKARFTDTLLNEAQQAIFSGEADVLTSLFHSEKRDRQFDFTDTMFDVPASIFVAADRPDIKGVEDLDGKAIAMQKGDYALEFLQSNGISFNVVETADFAEAVDLVASGKADAVIGDEQIVLYHAYSNGLIKRIKKVGEPLYMGRNCMAVKEGNRILRSILNKGIAITRKRGVLDRIQRKWLGVQISPRESFLVKYRVQLMGMLAGMVAMILLVWFWNLQLRKTVAGWTKELTRSEAALRTILTASPVGIGVLRGKVVNWHNEAMTRITGYAPEELLGKSPRILYAHEETGEKADLEITEMLRRQRVAGLETQWRRKDGSVFDCAIQYAPMGGKQEEGRFVVLVEDITDKKHMERLLSIQRDLGMALGAIGGLEAALRVCLDAMIKVPEIDCGGIYLVDAEDGAVNLTLHQGLSSEFTEMTRYFEGQSRHARMIARGEPVFTSYAKLVDALINDRVGVEFRRESGLLALGVMPVKHEGRVIAVLNAGSRTSESFSRFSRYSLENIASQAAGALARIEADQALKASQQNLSALFENLDDFLFVLDSSGRIVGFNPVVEKRLGYSPKQLLAMDVLAVHPPDRRKEAARIVKDMLEGTATHCPVPLLTADGRLIPVETKVSLGFWNNKQAVFGISRDITERLEMEAAGKKSEERLLAAIDAIDEGFVIYDDQDRLVLFNAKFAEIYQDTKDLLVPGARFEDVVREGAMRGQYPDAVGKEEEWVADRMAQHRLPAGSVDQRLKDGRWIKIAERKTADGSTVGFRVDITDIKCSEERTQADLREKEVLLKEIHHRVKNNMQVISSLLNLQSSKIAGKEVTEAFLDAHSRVQSMALVHEILYQSETLREIQLQSYLERLAAHIFQAFAGLTGGINIQIHAETATVGIDQAIPFGLIMNELLTNSLKYAFPSGAGGEIRVEVVHEANGDIVATVADNGIGLSSDLDPGAADTLGLQLVTELIEGQLEGAWQVNRDGGTTWTIRWADPE